MRSVVVTGVSTGIGHATAKVLIERGFRVFGSVRSESDATRLRDELGANFEALLFDVTDEAAVHAGAARVREALAGDTLAGLVNNAGIAVSGPLLEVPAADYRQQLEINLVGPFIVTQAFGPLLGAAPQLRGEPGRVINVSSAAGVRAMPFLGPYCASKHGLEGYSEALRRELMLFGIKVVIIGPGPVKSAIWDKAEDMDLAAYERSPFLAPMQRFRKMFLAQGRDGYPAERLGELVHHALTTAQPKLRYAPVKGRLAEKILTRVAPRSTLDRVIGKTLGLLPGS